MIAANGLSAYLELHVSVVAEGRVVEAVRRHLPLGYSPEPVRWVANPPVEEPRQEQDAVEKGYGVDEGQVEARHDPVLEDTTGVHG